MVLVDGVPLLQDDLFRRSSDLGGDELLEVADGIVGLALDAHLLAETVVANDTGQLLSISAIWACAFERGLTR